MGQIHVDISTYIELREFSGNDVLINRSLGVRRPIKTFGR